MRQAGTWVGLALGLVTAVETRADGLLHRLPEDGAWVRYSVTLLDQDGEMNGNMILRSVGQASVDGRECRWIEFHFEMGRMSGTIKLLIPESYLQSGHSPLDHVVRGWQRVGELATRKLDNGAGIALLPYLVTPPLTDSKLLDSPRGMEWQHGKLICAVRVGRLQLNPISPTGRSREEKVYYEVGFHDEIPFGVAMARLTVSMERDGEWKRTTTVTIAAADAGTDARSQLPEYR